MKNKILFVYGTLKRGEFNDISLYEPAPTFIGEGWVSGALYDLGHCPAMTLDNSERPVWGEVFEVDESLFAALDQYEDDCGDFVLEEVVVHMQGKAIHAWVYAAGPSQQFTREPLPDGRWPLTRGVRSQDVFPLGDQAVLVNFEQAVVGSRTELVLGFARTIREQAHPAVTDVVEAPGSVTVYYRPELLRGISEQSPFQQIQSFIVGLRCGVVAALGRRHTIPVCYALEFGPDLEVIAKTTGSSVEAVITRHLSQIYTVASQGFLPGFAYLEGVPSELKFPRLGNPRPRVVAGSVAIAEEMCGIYPQDSPGGWNLVGRTPIRMFQPLRQPPSMLLAGDKVTFKQISMDEFAEVSRG